MIIRDATLADIPEVAKLHVESWNKTYKGIIAQTHLDNMKNNIAKRIERMQKDFNLRKMVVAVIEDEIVAFSEFVFSNEFSKELNIDCELCGLYVKNEYLNKGIGTQVFNYVKDVFIKSGKNKMGLWCVKENKNAVNFYRRKGGIITSEKEFILAEKKYREVAFVYNLKESL